MIPPAPRLHTSVLQVGLGGRVAGLMLPLMMWPPVPGPGPGDRWRLKMVHRQLHPFRSPAGLLLLRASRPQGAEIGMVLGCRKQSLRGTIIHLPLPKEYYRSTVLASLPPCLLSLDLAGGLWWSTAMLIQAPSKGSRSKMAGPQPPH
ncbi:hypothetical protein NDU88_004644 [Pleurodeles waltl]|uniref:Uncharacterized protein n=1 Tax=Pleurodeles waltl TaxID=8319 RepID=A0AAV7WUX9_PLEWA|nr:hypothetical protein NDU88_004644 [Pleurodeles waltl]